MNITITISPTSPADLQAYLAILQALPQAPQAPVVALNVARQFSPDTGEEGTLAAEYRQETGKIFRLTKAEMASGISRLQALKGWRDGTRETSPDAPPDGEEQAPPPDDGEDLF